MGLSLGAGDSWDELRHQREAFSFNIHDGLDRAPGFGDLEDAGLLPLALERRRAPRVAVVEKMAAD